jgi:hypothetical protein
MFFLVMLQPATNLGDNFEVHGRVPSNQKGRFINCQKLANDENAQKI